ncbi:hypothetical protein FRB90_003010, partial [Tulasnella sp. 427]
MGEWAHSVVKSGSALAVASGSAKLAKASKGNLIERLVASFKTLLLYLFLREG